jgi:hypothetical protein
LYLDRFQLPILSRLNHQPDNISDLMLRHPTQPFVGVASSRNETLIIQALSMLSIDERLTIATIALTSTIDETQSHLMTELQLEQQLKIAANLAIDDYKNDPELTVFTSLDGSDFLE